MELKTLQEFQTQIKNGITIVDFWAPWCAPCKNFAPIFEKYSNNTKNICFAKVDIDVAPEIAADYGILSIPTLIVFKNGQEIERRIGSMDEITFKFWLEEIQ